MRKKRMVRGYHKLTQPVIVTMAVSNMYDQLDDNSFMRHYHNVNPELDGFPVLYDEEEMSWLDGSQFQEQIYEEKQFVFEDYDLLSKELEGFKDKFSLEYFTTQVYLVHSRNFISTVNDTNTNVLVPFADMINTNNPHNTAWYYNEQREGFVMEALTDIT